MITKDAELSDKCAFCRKNADEGGALIMSPETGASICASCIIEITKRMIEGFINMQRTLHSLELDAEAATERKN